MEAFEYKGIWWSPSAPDYQIYGTLKFDPVTGGTLETVGSKLLSSVASQTLENEIISNWIITNGTTTLPIICGVASATRVTLYQCVLMGTGAAPGYLTETFDIGSVFWGSHFEHETDLIFDSVSINYSFLDEWTGIHGFSGGITRSKTTGQPTEVELKFTPPDPIKARVQDFELLIRFELRSLDDASTKHNYVQYTYFEIRPDVPLTYNEYHKRIIYPLRNFLALGLNAAAIPRIVSVLNSRGFLDPTTGEELTKGADVYYAAKGAGNVLPEFSRIDTLFSFPMIANDFEGYLTRWFEKFESLRPVIELYFGTVYNTMMYTNFEFLALAQALEVYHREMYGGEYMSSQAYEPILAALVGSIPEGLSKDHRKSLTDSLAYGYQIGLRKRLNDIILVVLDNYSDTVGKLIGKRKTFVNSVVNTRNYYTHYSKRAKEGAITDPVDLAILVRRMKLLLQLCFLAEMGFPDSLVKVIVRRNRGFQRWLH
ncbi:MAG: hypothetical protein IPO91_14145 [Chloroflexi bacterium]|nr:hypothetical protein [Chloroflexota bacterium]